jgi:Ca2+-transporting ATPase
VAADARVLEASSLRCVESALTGESVAVNKRAVTLDRAEVPLDDRKWKWAQRLAAHEN